MYVCMYVCMVITYIAKDQPGKVANPARGQLNRENGFFPVPVRAWKLGVVWRVCLAVPSHVSLLVLVPTHEIPPNFRGGVHYLVIYTAIRHRVSPEFEKNLNAAAINLLSNQKVYY